MGAGSSVGLIGITSVPKHITNKTKNLALAAGAKTETDFALFGSLVNLRTQGDCAILGNLA